MLAIIVALAISAPAPPVGHTLTAPGYPPVPEAFCAAVQFTKRSRMIRQQYQRPASGGPAHGTKAFNSVGSTLKEGRRVRESECPLAHVSEASLCRTPDPS